MMKYSHNAEVLIEQVLIPLHDKAMKGDFVNGTVELINANIEFAAGGELELYLGDSRKPQRKYIENEKNWYLSENRCIKGYPGIEDNKVWSRICTDTGMVNSNYGWCVFSTENGNKNYYPQHEADKLGSWKAMLDARVEMSQYDFAMKQLMEKPEGRQSIIYYSRPSMQWEWCDGVNAKSDFTCTISTQHFIRKNRLDYIVTMRSNDAIFGLQAGDLPWHGYVYNRMREDLRRDRISVDYGTIYWNAASLHVYERHYDLLDKIVQEYKAYKQARVIYNQPGEGHTGD